MDLFRFALCVLSLCYKHQGSVTSWGRTAKHNKAVGGVPESYHLLWFGCDVVLDEMAKNSVFEQDAHYFGLVALLEGDHYHLQPDKIPA